MMLYHQHDDYNHFGLTYIHLSEFLDGHIGGLSTLGDAWLVRKHTYDGHGALCFCIQRLEGHEDYEEGCEVYLLM